MTNYALEGPRWTSSVINWNFAAPGNTAFTNAIGTAYQGTIRAAAALWAAAANVTLREVPAGTSGADITVGWGSFSGTQVGQTTYSFSRGTPPSFQPGVTIHIEDPALLSLGAAAGATYQGTATTLYQVALHEFGHALGLGLSTDPNSVMNIRLGSGNVMLNASDLAGIAALYGARVTVAQMPASSAGSDTVNLTGDTIAIYRFFDSQSGTQFLTSSVSEMNTIFSSRSDLRFEGLGIGGVSIEAADPHAAPIYRFFDKNNGSHFLTASQAEANAVTATRPDLIAEPASFAEHLSAQPGDVAVFRFFDTHAGTHFFTADDGERASIIADRADLAYEGVAFYAPAPS